MSEQRQFQVASISTAIVVSLALAFTAGCTRDPNVRKQKFLESGKRYEADGKYKEAEIQFSNALKLDKNFADAHYELAKVYLKLNSPVPAYSELMKTVDLAPKNLEARTSLGDLLLAGHAPDRAADQANAVLAINPNSADAYALLAGVAQSKGDHAEAVKDMEHAISIDPNRSTFHSALALLDAGDLANEPGAEQELQKAASLDPKSATPHLLLAQLLEKKGDAQGAEQQFQQAISISPKNMEARGALADLYFRGGDKAKTEQTLQQAVQENPDEAAASSMLASFYGQEGQLDRAVAVFTDLNSKYPKSFAIRLTYARLLFNTKDFAKSTAVVSQLTKSDPGNPDVQTLNAQLLLNTGKTDDAFTTLKKAVKDSPNSFDTQLLLAKVALAKGDIGTSETALRAASKLNPASIEVASGLAEIAGRRNDPSMLSETAENMIRLHPDFPNAYLWRGTAEASRKEYDKAEADFQTVLKKDPNSAAAYLELGQIRVAQGHAPEGQAMVEKALEKDPSSTRALEALVSYDLRAKQPAKAIARVQAQIVKVPGNGGFYDLLAVLQYQAKDYKDALDNSHKAMQLNPSSAGPVQTYVQSEIALGDLDSAISVWQGWTNSHPNDSQAYQMLGSLEESKGEQSKAADLYKKALQLDPNNAVASNNLAYIMVENGQNVDVALTLAQTARRILPDSPQTADTLAWVYYYKQNYGEARDLLESALKDTPDDASLHFHLGMTYGKLNDKADAQLHLKKAVALAPNGKAGKDAAAALGKLG